MVFKNKIKMANVDVNLPSTVRNRILRAIQYDYTEREEVFNKFVEKILKLNDEDPESFNKVYVNLSKNNDKKFKETLPESNLKKLSFRKRKDLGLYFLGKKSMKYNDLLPLHKLWTEYMTKYMNLDELREQKWSNNHEDPNFDSVSLKLFRADYHGSIMAVLKSECPSYVGKSGIVVMESKNCFKLLGSDNILRTIPKASNLFRFKLKGFEFKFLGKNLQAKPADRSSKKIKTIYSSDLQL